ncbi:MAG TPA: VCBS repeat-containing protein [Candidatus Thermoplasmatota archaeon]|nr:VCBS repeat-containing protein [Candidatus Thermoplasmatota archaeon]
MRGILVGAGATCALLLAFSLAPAAATHAQPGPDGTSMRFDHDGDNEWWVEVLTREGSGTQVVALATQVEGAGSHPMKRIGVVDGWDKWTPSQSFRVPAGARVAFDAHVIDAQGDAHVIRSCWFTHPAGTEQCGGTPPPPSGWAATLVGQAGSGGSGGDMAVADVDNDGRPDVVVARSNGLRVYEWSGSTWVPQLVSSRSFDAVAAGDGDGDGRREVYAVTPSAAGRDLMEYRFVDGAWRETPLLGFRHGYGNDLTIGDIDGQAGPELYASMTDMECDPDPNVPLCSTSSKVYLVRKAGGVWGGTAIADLSGTIDTFWIADADNNARYELYIGHHTRHADRVAQLQHVAGAWQATALPGTGSESGWSQVVAGDGDRDGRQEVYAANYYGSLRKITYTQTGGWQAQDIFTQHSPPTAPDGQELRIDALALGDGDGDGSQELYFTTSRDAVYQVRASGGSWVLTRTAAPTEAGVIGTSGPLVVGDGDGDGRREVYTTAAFEREGQQPSNAVYKVHKPASGFDASFTGVRGNEWWVQAAVSATGGTLSKVEVSLDGGSWKPLAKQDWGAWAASYHIRDGTVVQLRATSTSGATDLSDCYKWIPASGKDAAKVTCGSAPPPSAFDASFSGVKGNEWWVQVNVAANEPVAKVEARVGCGGTWQVLPKQDWGAYAKSFHVPSGSKVDFRATSASGATDLSGGYVWPNATPTSAC